MATEQEHINAPRNNPERKSDANALLKFVYAAGLIAVFVFCAFYTVWSHSDTLSNQSQRSLENYIIQQQHIAEALKMTDTVQVRTDLQRDSIIAVVRGSQLMVLRDLQTLNDDFRQEMNNNINKVNTWLAFAIGLVSVLGIFIPLALQYRMQSQDEKKFESLSHDISHKMKVEADRYKTAGDERFNVLKQKNDRYLRNLQSRYQNKSEELEKLITEVKTQKKEVGRMKDELKSEIHLSRLSADFNAFHIGADNNLLNHHADRESIFLLIWQSTVRSFENLVAQCSLCTDDTGHNRLDAKHRLLLIEAMIKLHGMVMIMKNHRGDGRHRDLWKIADLSEKILTDLGKNNTSQVACNEIAAALSELTKLIGKLEVPFNI